MDEIIEIMQRLFREETIAHEGEFYRFAPVCFEPKPLQKPSIPLHIGGESAPAKRRAARVGAGWIMTYLGPTQEVAEKTAEVHALRRDFGRSDTPFEITGSVPRDVSLDQLRAYAKAGVDRVIVDALGSRSAQDVVDTLRGFQAATLSKF
jgi:alkanesulfonate monooxygenase SsuD/methylene tetrahydromethanopterin reductase-like flavin-dependent oxidoreductase (luciferase family)